MTQIFVDADACPVKDEIEPISSGTHIRFVVETAKTVERLKAKAAKRAARSPSST